MMWVQMEGHQIEEYLVDAVVQTLFVRSPGAMLSVEHGHNTLFGAEHSDSCKWR